MTNAEAEEAALEPFTVGQTYRRRDLHRVFGGQRQGGISTPATQPFTLLFTGEPGHQFGYEDQFQPDGTFWYTGDRQEGDMQMVRDNAAIRNHAQNKKRPLLFEGASRSHVRFLGEAHYVGHHEEAAPDRNGTRRQALVFELSLDTSPVGFRAGRGYGWSSIG